MSRIIAILIANFFVVDYGVVPDEKDNSVYVIQIEPEVATQLIEGYVIESVIPPELRGIRKFRIQIGNDKLIKPTSMLPTLEEADDIADDNSVPVTTDGDNNFNEVRKTEVTGPKTIRSEEASDLLDFPVQSNPTAPNAKSVDRDAFPLQEEPEDRQPTDKHSLIPDQVEATELPGSATKSVDNHKIEQMTLEPEVTTLPLLTKVPTVGETSDMVMDSPDITNQSDVELVVIPVFDNPDSELVADVTVDNGQTANATLAFLNNTSTEDRVLLGPLPDLVTLSDTSELPEANADNEPELLKEESSNFVRLATATSNGPNVSASNSPGLAIESSDENRSWPLFSVTLLGLLISVGGNIYLGMTILDFYRKNRRLSSDMAKSA